MKKYTKKEIEDFIEKKPISIIYFSGESCNVCPIIKNKLKIILENYKEVDIIEIDVSSNREISASYNIFSIPVLLLFVEGKESLRYGRNIDFMEFEKNLNRYYQLVF